MWVLVTRPAEEGRRTARRLEALGAEPLLRPLTRIAFVDRALPDCVPDALAATSAHALQAVGSAVRRFVSTPLFAVGGRTAAAARAAGFSDVREGGGSALALARAIAAMFPRGSTVLFLAGAPRKPDLESALAAAGMQIVVAEVYRAIPAGTLTPADLPGPVDAVLHYSRASAERFCDALAPELRDAMAAALHGCLSADVAAGLAALAPRRIAVAAEPTETSLFAALNLSH